MLRLPRSKSTCPNALPLPVLALDLVRFKFRALSHTCVLVHRRRISFVLCPVFAAIGRFNRCSSLLHMHRSLIRTRHDSFRLTFLDILLLSPAFHTFHIPFGLLVIGRLSRSLLPFGPFIYGLSPNLIPVTLFSLH